MWLVRITFISLMLAPEENSEDQKSLGFRVSHRDVQFRSTACFNFLCPSCRRTPQQLTRRLRVNLLHCCRAGAPAEPDQWPTLGPDLRFKAVHPLQRPGCLGSSSGSWCINPSCSAVTSSGETETLTGWSALRQLYPYYLINTLLTFDI